MLIHVKMIRLWLDILAFKNNTGYALLLKTNVNVHGAFDQERIGRSSSIINNDSIHTYLYKTLD